MPILNTFCVLFFLLLVPNFLFSQELDQLSYAELDSLMYVAYQKDDALAAISIMEQGVKKSKRRVWRNGFYLC